MKFLKKVTEISQSGNSVLLRVLFDKTRILVSKRIFLYIYEWWYVL